MEKTDNFGYNLEETYAYYLKMKDEKSEELNNGVNYVVPYPIGTYLIKREKDTEYIDLVYKYVISQQGISVILLLDIIRNPRPRQSNPISLEKLISEWKISNLNYSQRIVGPVRALKKSE